MRRLVWIPVVLCAVAVAFLLAGCGGGASGTSTGGSVTTAGKPAPPPPPFSPALAYAHHEMSTGSAICIANSTGSQVKQVSSVVRGQYDVCPAWSPDGQWVAFLRGPEGNPTQLCMVRSDATGLKTAWTFSPANGPMPAANDMDWLPDGSKLLLTGPAYGNGFFAFDPSSGTIEKLCGPDSLALSGNGVDEGWIILNAMGTFSVGPDTDPGTPGFQGLIVYEANGTGTDAEDLCFVRVSTDPVTHLLVRADGKTYGPTVILSLPGTQYGGVDFSPDGRFLAVTGSAPLLSVVSVADNGGTDIQFGTPQALSTGTSSFAHVPTWSPDGKWVAYDGGLTVKSWPAHGIFRTPNPSGNPVLVTQDAAKFLWYMAPDWNPKWTPDL